jgi:hypothetical protein
MHDQPEPTEEEQEQVPERLEEEDAMRGPRHEDPERAREGDDDA